MFVMLLWFLLQELCAVISRVQSVKSAENIWSVSCIATVYCIAVNFGEHLIW